MNNGSTYSYCVDQWLKNRIKLKRQLIIAAIATAILCGCQKTKIDEEVRRLCAEDGGIKIYEVVKLPADKFNHLGQINFYRPTKGEEALGVDYSFQVSKHYYLKGNPEMTRTHIKVYRRNDRKVLGELVLYGRGGGDFPSPMHDSSFQCPDSSKATEIILFTRIFESETGRSQ